MIIHEYHLHVIAHFVSFLLQTAYSLSFRISAASFDTADHSTVRGSSSILHTQLLCRTSSWGYPDSLEHQWLFHEEEYPGVIDIYHPWILHSSIDTMKNIAKVMNVYLEKIMNYFVHRIANKGADEINSNDGVWTQK